MRRAVLFRDRERSTPAPRAAPVISRYESSILRLGAGSNRTSLSNAFSRASYFSFRWPSPESQARNCSWVCSSGCSSPRYRSMISWIVFCGSVFINTVVRICWSIYLNYFLKSYCGTGMPDGAYDRYDYNTIKELFYTKVESDSSERRVVLVFAMHGAIPAGCGGN